MAELVVGISGRIETGETLKAVTTEPGAGLQWQAYLSGNWVNVGTTGSATYAIPANAVGVQYRVIATHDGSVFFSEATPPAVQDTNKKAAPSLSGQEFSRAAIEGELLAGVFSPLAFSDADKGNYGSGSLLVTSTDAANGLLTIGLGGTSAGDFSYNAATGELMYAFRNGNATVIGSIDPVQNGAGTALKVIFNGNATKAVVDALVDKINFTATDDSPLQSCILTLRVTDPTGGAAQRAVLVDITPVPDAPVFNGPAEFVIDENETVAGLVTAVDPDREEAAPQGISYSLVGGAGGADNALFTIDALTGALSFLQAPDYEDAAHGPAYSVRVLASDANGGMAEQVITVVVRDVNEAPVLLGGDTAGVVVEAGAAGAGSPTAAGRVEAQDPDAGDTLTWSGAGTGTYGSLALDAVSGQWIYTLDNDATQVQTLSEGEVVLDTFQLLATDSNGASAAQQITVQVHGGNDAPALVESASTLTGTVTEPAHTGKLLLDVSGPWESDFDFLLDPAGMLLVLGKYADPLTGSTHASLARYHATGELDVSFGQGGMALLGVGQNSGLALDAQGRAIVTGWAYQGYGEGGTAVDWVIERYLPDGTPDASFGSGGQITFDIDGGYDYALHPWVQPSGHILVFGSGPVLARFNEDGTQDMNFGAGGLWRPDSAHGTMNGIAVDALGRIIVSSHVIDPATGAESTVVARYTPEGGLDPSFGDGGVVSLALGASASQVYLAAGAQGGLTLAWLAPGSELFENNVMVARLGTAGELDEGFGDAGLVQLSQTARYLAGLEVDAQGRTVLQLDRQTDDDFLLTRLHVDGTVDSSFGGGSVSVDFDGGIDRPFVTLVQSDGGLLVAGYSSNGGSDDLAFARLGSDGALDPLWGTLDAAQLVATGMLHATDPDETGTLLWSGTAEGTYGDLLVDASGAWTYTLDPSLQATRALTQGQIAVDRFTATVVDSAGATSSYELAVEVVGSAAFAY